MSIRRSSFLASALFLVLPTFGQSFDPPVAVDTNPDPTIVEVDLVAAETTWEYIPGVPTTVWAYNGSVPGPTIKANVGDTIRVHFTNNLPEPTTIHWHGPEIPANMEGSHIAQLPIQPGATFDYEFVVDRAAMYWYHPHVRTFDQVEKGLHGVLLVYDPAKDAQLGFDQLEEHVVVFDDILLDANMEVVPAFSFTDPLQNSLYHLNGREGNFLLVNGRESSTVTLPVNSGQGQRWRIVNAANTTFCRLDLRDADDGMTSRVYEVGSDGGLLESPFAKLDVTNTGPEHPGQALLSEMGQGVLLLPGERNDIVFTPIGNDGEIFTIYQHDWFRGRHNASYDVSGNIVLGDDPMDGAYPEQVFMQMQVVGTGGSEFVPPAQLTEILSLGTPIGDLPVTFGHGNPDPATGNVVLFAQATMPGGVLTPLPAPKIDSFIAHDVEIGDTWTWNITNLTHGDHPFHTHGFFFMLESYEFQDDLDPLLNFDFFPGRKRIKDTIRIPARLGAKGSSRTIARLTTTFAPRAGQNLVAQGGTPTFDKSGDYTSGGWLFHCHILEHSGKGMLSWYEVRDPNDPYHDLGKELNGTLGKASLTASGDLDLLEPVTFDMVNAPADTQAYLIASTTLGKKTIAGGTLVPSLSKKIRNTTTGAFGGVLVRTSATDSSGCLSIDLNGWQSLASGTTVYAQVVFPDAGGPNGWGFSNAIQFDVP